MPDELITGATSPTYTLTALDVGRYVYCRVRGTNVAGNASVDAVAVGPIVSSGPDVTAPTITSASAVSNVENSVLAHGLTADEAVTWSIVGGADSARFELSGATLRWTGNGTKDFEVPDDADTDNAYVVQVRATDAATNAANQTITVTVTNVVEAPVLLIAPAITPMSPEEGVELTSTPGTWAGDVATYSYEWHQVTGVLPSNSVAPAVSGTTEVGSSLSCTTGTWAGDPTIIYSYQWKRAPSTPIGTDLASYMLVSGDVGFSILCTVTATNPVGSVPLDSNTVGPVTAPATAPDVVGTTARNNGHGGDRGEPDVLARDVTGTPTITYSYQWKRGMSSSRAATAPAVTSKAPVEGVELTSTPGTWAGDVATYSYEWHSVTGALPSNSAAPAVTGTTEIGSSLSCTTGTWAGDPTITYSYQWKRAPSTPIGTDANSYMLVSGDVGFSILCTVTATNPVGSVPQDSNTVGPITAPATAPSLSGLPPVITGTVAIGASLTCSTGTWAGTPTITYSYQWKRGVTNVGTDSSSYTLVSGDAGSQISCVVTATNGVGSASATADAVGPVPIPTTWSPAHVGANLVLSGGNLTITEVTVDATRQSHIRGTSSRSSPDKRYFEITLVAWSGGDNWGFGLSDSSGPAGDTLAGSSIVGTSNSKGFILEYTGRVKAETAIAAVFVPAPVAGDVFGFACNLSTNEVWVRKNGTWLNGDPVAGYGGISWGAAALDAMYPYFTSPLAGRRCLNHAECGRERLWGCGADRLCGLGIVLWSILS